MNLFAVAVLGAGLVAGQPPGYTAFKKRALALPIEYNAELRSKIRHTQLFVSRDLGQTWTLESTITPDKAEFPFTARDDGPHWFHMVTVFTDGKKAPADVTTAPNPEKILIDATPPALTVGTAVRTGDEALVEWTVEEQYPAVEKTRVAYRTAGSSDADWKDVPHAGKSARFAPPSGAGVQVRVTVEDVAGNVTAQIREIAGPMTAALAAPAEQPKPATPLIAPPTIELVAQPPAMPAPAMPAPVVNVAKPTDPPAELRTPAVAPPPQPLASGSGTGTALPAAAATDGPPVQLINYARFELPYHLDVGPSGVRQFDLYVTRDDGASWQKWSTHDGKEAPLKVSLDARPNARIEGSYGFALVPIAGSGTSDDPPRSGTPPEFRVKYDRTPPTITIYEPAPDAADRSTLVLQWQVADANLGKDPVGLEWGESAAGPWKPVVPGAAGLQAVAAGQADPTRVPNTGSYPWKVPANLPPAGVYLKVTAWDAAGNKSEIATPRPVQVDLVKPKARIQGIVPAGK